MSLLEMGGKRWTIPTGEVLLGSDPGCAIALSGPGLLPRHIVLQGQPDGQVAIRKASPEADVNINGVRLGSEPTPLLHGDKVQVAGNELTFVDERRSGSTQYISAMKVPDAAAQAKAGAGKPTANTGGRVVCLTDGREYTIAGPSLVFGREAGCDVVVSGKDVSRRHAEIVSSPKGYLLVDSSTNGTFVNEERVQGQRILARADVIRIGDEQFRFYADVAAPPPSPAATPPTRPQPGPATNPPPAAPLPATVATAAAVPPSPPPEQASAKLRNTSFGAPAVKPPPHPPEGAAAPRASAAFLANLIVRSGSRKGQRLPIKTPIVNIGRADYNDIALPDESVSTSHAKLQRREGVWVLVDLDSTNGSFVDGERVKGDAPVAPGATLRFGDVQAIFETMEADDALGVAKGGGTKLMTAMKSAAPPAAPAPAAKPAVSPPAAKPAAPKRPPVPPPVAEKKGKGCGSSAAVIVLGMVAVAYWFLA